MNNGAAEGGEETVSPPEEIDTDVRSIARKFEDADPKKPFMITIGVRAVTLRRINLDRKEGETFGKWIITAVNECLNLAEQSDESGHSLPPDYTPTYGTPDVEIINELSEADLDEWLSVTVEFPAGALIALLQVAGNHQSVAECIRAGLRIQLSKSERKGAPQPTARVEVSPEIAQRARLRAVYETLWVDNDNYSAAFFEALKFVVAPQTEFTVSGQVFASFEDSSEGFDVAAIRDALDSVEDMDDNG